MLLPTAIEPVVLVSALYWSVASWDTSSLY